MSASLWMIFYDYLRRRIVNLESFLTEVKTEKRSSMTQKIKHFSSLQEHLFLIWIPTRTRIVLALLCLRHRILETIDIVKEGKSEIRGFWVLLDRWCFYLCFYSKHTQFQISSLTTPKILLLNLQFHYDFDQKKKKKLSWIQINSLCHI